MPWYDDLTPYGNVGASDKLLAVGWLKRGHAYHKGEIDSQVVRKLVELLIDPWQAGFAVSGGVQPCGFCRISTTPPTLYYGKTNTRVIMGVSNLFVPGDGVLYVAPSLILHYMDSHEYAPPAVFCEAVLACPPMRSMDYLRAIIKNGPPGFARVARVTPRKAE